MVLAIYVVLGLSVGSALVKMSSNARAVADITIIQMTIGVPLTGLARTENMSEENKESAPVKMPKGNPF